MRDNICAKLTKFGYVWKMSEGWLLINSDDQWYRINLQVTGNPAIFMVYFFWDYRGNLLQREKCWKLDLLSCIINRENPYTSIVILKTDTMLCRYMGSIATVEDFFREFKTAQQTIQHSVSQFFDELVKIDNMDAELEEEVEQELGTPDRTDERNEKQPDPEILLQRANEGHTESQYHLGVLYTFGDSNTQVDMHAAFSWYEKAASQGHMRALYNMAACYNNGCGTAYDHDKAISILEDMKQRFSDKETLDFILNAIQKVNNVEYIEFLD